MTTAYVGFGANLNDPIEQIISARKRLIEHSGISSLQCSSFYVSSPVGYTRQADFINCVASINTSLEPLELLSVMQVIEKSLGRCRNPNNQNAARTIDLDLLLFGEQVIESRQLIVPHPRMTERLFVLKPLRELGDDIVIGQEGTVSQTIELGYETQQFEGQSLFRLAV